MDDNLFHKSVFIEYKNYNSFMLFNPFNGLRLNDSFFSLKTLLQLELVTIGPIYKNTASIQTNGIILFGSFSKHN